MIKVTIPKESFWDEENECFIQGGSECTLTLEHSLLSVSKWEAIWRKPFLEKRDKSVEEVMSYIECMVVSPSKFDPEVIKRLPQAEYIRIDRYINNPSTATIIPSRGGGGTSRFESKNITSEEIYYWMIAATIPFECQKWHLNRLLTLLRVCEFYSSDNKTKKRSESELRREYDRLNEIRRAKLGSKG